jgi:hypothetical protein
VQLFDLIKKSSITQNSLIEKPARLLFQFELAHKPVYQTGSLMSLKLTLPGNTGKLEYNMRDYYYVYFAELICWVTRFALTDDSYRMA